MPGLVSKPVLFPPSLPLGGASSTPGPCRVGAAGGLGGVLRPSSVADLAGRLGGTAEGSRGRHQHTRVRSALRERGQARAASDAHMRAHHRRWVRGCGASLRMRVLSFSFPLSFPFPGPLLGCRYGCHAVLPRPGAVFPASGQNVDSILGAERIDVADEAAPSAIPPPPTRLSVETAVAAEGSTRHVLGSVSMKGILEWRITSVGALPRHMSWRERCHGRTIVNPPPPLLYHDRHVEIEQSLNGSSDTGKAPQLVGETPFLAKGGPHAGRLSQPAVRAGLPGAHETRCPPVTGQTKRAGWCFARTLLSPRSPPPPPPTPAEDMARLSPTGLWKGPRFDRSPPPSNFLVLARFAALPVLSCPMTYMDATRLCSLDAFNPRRRNGEWKGGEGGAQGEVMDAHALRRSTKATSSPLPLASRQ